MSREYVKKKYKIRSTTMYRVSRLIISVGILFITLSIVSGRQADPSLFVAYSYPSNAANWCGAFGAHIFAIAFYLFGYAAFLYIPFNLTFMVLLWYKRSALPWKYYSVMSLSIITVCAFLIQAQCNVLFSLSDQQSVGGYCGFYIAQVLYSICNRIGSLIVGYTVLLLLSISCLPISDVWFVASAKAFVHASVIALRYLFCALGLLCLYMRNALRMSIRGLYRKKSTTAQSGNDKKMISTKTPYENLPQEQNRQSKRDNASVIRKKSLRNLFQPHVSDDACTVSEKELQDLVKIIEEKLAYFGVRGQVIAIQQGPVVTLFEYQPTIDSKISKILALEDDLALALKALSIRIIAPIPGRSVIGLEISNRQARPVLFSSLIASSTYTAFSGSLPLVLGQDTVGNPVVIDLAKMPHLLIAGSTGSGKSVALHSMIMSLLCAHGADMLRLVLIDPKRLEFSLYTDIAHLLFPIVTYPRKSIPILRWLVHEMEMRYEKMAARGVRNIIEYNHVVSPAEMISFIVVIIDELADLMMTTGKELEDLIARIAQMARASGIHMIIATQRPSVDVITGTIKVNFPARISLRVTSKIDSRTILDASGAQRLLGKGDMLFLDAQSSSITRVHGAYVSDQEIVQVVEYLKQQQSVEYQTLDLSFEQSVELVTEEDEQLLTQIVQYLKTIDEVSISLLQRKFRIGYNRSARMIEILEQRGCITPCNSGKSRKVVR